MAAYSQQPLGGFASVSASLQQGLHERRIFRTGLAYDLVAFDRLLPEEQIFVGELRHDPAFYGLLRPRAGTGRTVKAVGKETALLWFTLQSSGPLPFFAREKDSIETPSAIRELLLDGVIEIEENGRFVSGSEAAAIIGRERQTASASGRLAAITNSALRYGESLFLDDPRQLAARLYGFGRHPVTPHWASVLSDSDDVLSFVGAGEGTALRAIVDSDWQVTEGQTGRAWISWSNRMRPNSQLREASYKLYVSPCISDLPRVFATIVKLASDEIAQFKIGSNAAGLLRPDKMVLYFASQEELLKVATKLAPLLEGVLPHGVPFTSEIMENGLLSWGMDPPSQRLLSWQEPESWRLWIVRRLAAFMIGAQSESNATMTPGTFALERLRCEGVDVDRWIPSKAMWQIET